MHATKFDDVCAGNTCYQAAASTAAWHPGLSLQRLPQPVQPVVFYIQAPDQELPKSCASSRSA